MLTYLQAIVIALLQGVTELFPISSLGHSVLVPAWIGGSWMDLVTQSSTGDSANSPYLAFIVALHVATAIALLIFFRRDWVRIIAGFFRSLGPSVRARRVVARDGDERLAWLIVIATIPVGLTGLLLEHTFRTLFAKPLAAAVFLTVNGLILLAGEWLRRVADDEAVESAERTDSGAAPTRRAGAPFAAACSSAGGTASCRCTTARRSSSGFSRRSRSSPGSAARASRWSAGWSAACRTRTPRGSRSSSPPPSSSPLAC